MKHTVVAGHTCLDIIPAIDRPFDLQPGRLYEVGAASLAAGGAVPNTGVALHILGIPTTLVGKIGSDGFGDAIASVIKAYGSHLTDGMIVDPAVATSYTLVVNIPNTDRTFLHCPGANHTFGLDDINPAALAGADLFHFGYPPLMRRMYADNGRELVDIYKRVKAANLTSSLDMTTPDPGGPSGQANWRVILQGLLPHVDIFLPSADEILYMLDRDKFGLGDSLEGPAVTTIGNRLLEMGVGIAGVKLGSRGLYLRTAGANRLAAMGKATPGDLEAWANRELWFPVYAIDRYVGATGAGDTTIAGFLAAFLRDQSIEVAGTFANAVGSCNVQVPDALSGIRSWDETRALLDAGWQQDPLQVAGPGWQRDPATGIWHGPADAPGAG